jgi:hypothetical protein
VSELVSNRVSDWTFAPELLRNGRSQLRQGRIVAVMAICAALSLSAVAYFFYSPDASPAEKSALDLVRTMVIVQIAVLLIGGGIYCLQSVHKEKELNTFDYQRITRLRPIELAVGKLMGAPALTYLIVLCLMPVTLVAAFIAQISIWTLLQIYLILLLGSITFHALALLISLIAPRGSSAGTILFFLLLTGMGSMTGVGTTFAIRQVSPFFAAELLYAEQNPSLFAPLPPVRDLFLGQSVLHFLVLVIIYVTFSGFFLLAVARNIKRDPSVYEIYAPWQGLTFVLYLNALALGFFRWATPQCVPRPPGVAGPFVPRMELRPISASAAEVTFFKSGYGCLRSSDWRSCAIESRCGGASGSWVRRLQAGGRRSGLRLTCWRVCW